MSSSRLEGKYKIEEDGRGQKLLETSNKEI